MGTCNEEADGAAAATEIANDKAPENYQLSPNFLPKEKWLHRKLARNSVEKMLEQRGSFLIRESCSADEASLAGVVGGQSGAGGDQVRPTPTTTTTEQPNSNNVYALSYRNQSDELCHFKIIQSCGECFIGNKRFQSLEHLVDYYMHVGCIVQNEFLAQPCPPKSQQESQKRRMVAKHNYTRVVDTHELSLTLGEILLVENDFGGGWFWLQSQTSGHSGWVHEILVEPFVACLEELKSKDYFAVCDRDEAVRYLHEAEPGSFLIREGTRKGASDPITLTLCVRTQDKVARFKVEVKSECVSVSRNEEESSDVINNEVHPNNVSRTVDVYWMGGRKFTSIDALVARYQNEEILEGLLLTHPPRMLLEDRLKKEMEMHQKNMSSNKRPAFDDVMSPTTEEEQQSWNMLQKQISSCSQDASELVASCDSVLQKGFLDKCKLSSLAAVSKKWKRCFFVLKARDQILYCFEDTNLRRRPKDLIDMTVSQVYAVDSSLCERKFGFQLVTRMAANDTQRPSIMYLVANSASERQDWMSSLMMCQGKFPFLSSVGQLLEQKSVEKLMETKSRECVNLYLEVKEVVDLASSKVYSFMPSNHHLLVMIQLDDIPYAKTCSLDQIKSQCTFQKFTFKKLSLELKTVRLLLLSKAKKSREIDLGVAMIHLTQLPKNKLFCSKLPLLPVAKNICGTTCGASNTLPSILGNVKCEIFLKHFTILPEHMYKKLRDCLLSEEGPALMYQIGQCIPVDDRNFFSSLLLKTYLYLKSEIKFIHTLNSIEIQQEDVQMSLFRSTSLAASVMEHYLNIVMLPFVQHTLQPIIDDIKINADVIGLHSSSPSSASSSSSSAAAAAVSSSSVSSSVCASSLLSSGASVAAVASGGANSGVNGALSMGSPHGVGANGSTVGMSVTAERMSVLAKKYLQWLADSILGHVDSFPTNLRYILQQIKADVDKKWPSSGESSNSAGHSPSHTINAAHGQSQNHSSATDQSQTSRTPFFRYRVIASFIFLRCISLALCTPRKYNLHIGSPPNISPVQDLLKLLAKLLQNWANFTPLKENSSFNVHPLNSYLRQHQQRMEFFLEGVSTSPQGTHDTIHKVGGYCDVAEKFASIHRICCDNYEALRKRSISYPALKKLLFIVDEISEHSSYPHSNQPSSGNHHNPHNKPQQHHPSRHNNPSHLPQQQVPPPASSSSSAATAASNIPSDNSAPSGKQRQSNASQQQQATSTNVTAAPPLIPPVPDSSS